MSLFSLSYEPTFQGWSWRLVDRLTFNIVDQTTLSDVAPFKNLFIYFLPEVVLVIGLLCIFVNMAFKLHMKMPKKLIAFECLWAVRLILVFAATLYLLYTFNDITCSILLNHFSINAYNSSLKSLLVTSGIFIVEIS